MPLITYELQFQDGTWHACDDRVRRDRVDEEITRLEAGEQYRAIHVQEDPHWAHKPSDIVRSASGLDAYCAAEGCTWYHSHS